MKSFLSLQYFDSKILIDFYALAIINLSAIKLFIAARNMEHPDEMQMRIINHIFFYFKLNCKTMICNQRSARIDFRCTQRDKRPGYFYSPMPRGFEVTSSKSLALRMEDESWDLGGDTP